MEYGELLCLLASVPTFGAVFYAIENKMPVLACCLSLLACQLIYHAAGMSGHGHL